MKIEINQYLISITGDLHSFYKNKMNISVSDEDLKKITSKSEVIINGCFYKINGFDCRLGNNVLVVRKSSQQIALD